MKKYLNKVLIIDGSYCLHRALHTPGLQELCTSTGIKSGGVFGVLRILQSEIKRFPGYFPIFCWDKGLSDRRTALYPDYKHQREREEADSLIAAGLSDPDEYLLEYRRQRADVIAILKSLGIPSLLLPGWEGDDLMWILSESCKDGVILSDDKDMIQLVSPSIKIRRAMKDEVIDWDISDEYYHHPRFTIRKSIVGDGSDNIPQVAAGVGDKTADTIADLIKDVSYDEYKNKLTEVSNDCKPSLKKKIDKVLENWSQFEINYQLTDLRLVEPPVGLEQMIKDLITITVGHSNIMRAYQLIGVYEMNSIYPDQILGMIAASSLQVLIKEINDENNN